MNNAMKYIFTADINYVVLNASDLPFTDNFAYFEVVCPAILFKTQQYIPS